MSMGRSKMFLARCAGVRGVCHQSRWFFFISPTFAGSKLLVPTSSAILPGRGVYMTHTSMLIGGITFELNTGRWSFCLHAACSSAKVKAVPL